MKISANGISVNYTFDGPANAPVVTMSHSLATDLGMWDPTVPALTGRFRVLRYETRGHGKTEAPRGPYTLDQLADDALALLRALGIQRTHWVGLSMGGMIGQALALKAPEVLTSLSLCDTSSRIPADAKPQWEDRIRTAEAKGMEPLVEPTLGRWFTAPFREKKKDVVDKLPTVVIVGEDDPGTPVAASRVIADNIKGSRLEIIPAAAHLSNMEQPEKFNKALSGFLATAG